MSIFNTYKGLKKEIYVLFISKVVTCMGSMVWSMMTFLLSDKLGLLPSEISRWMVVSSLAGMPFVFIGGKLADRCDKVRLIIITDIIETIAYFFCFFAPLTRFSMIVYLTVSVIENLSGPSYGALIAELSSSEDRDKANSLLYLGTNLGLMFTPTIGGFLIKINANYLFGANAIATLFALIIEIIFLKDVKPVVDNTNEYEAPKDDHSIWEVLKGNFPVVVFLFVSSLEQLIYGEWNFLIPLDLSAVHGDNGSVIYGIFSSINCITVVLFTALITKLFSKTSDTVEFTLSICAFALGFGIFTLFTDNMWLCFVSSFIFTIGEIMATLSCDPFVTRRIPSTHRGRILSYGWIIGNLIYSVGQLPISEKYEQKGSNAAWTAVFILCGVVIAMMLAMYPLDKKRYPKLYENINRAEENPDEA